MNRREFLKLRIQGTERVLELSCESLYMRYVDTRAGVELARLANEVDSDGGDWGGEPPLVVVIPTTEDLLAELDTRLASADVLRLSGREWLSRDDFGREVTSRIDAFHRAGGRVE